MWATVLFLNVDTLQVYEEAILQSEQEIEQSTDPEKTTYNGS
jgi:hypothetical protein